MVGHGGIWAGILDTWSSISVAVTVRKSSRRRTGRYHFALPLIGPLAQMDQRRSRPVGLIKLRAPLSVARFQEADTCRAWGKPRPRMAGATGRSRASTRQGMRADRKVASFRAVCCGPHRRRKRQPRPCAGV